MRKRLLGVMIIALSLFSINVKADAYYKNENGLELTEFQYKVLVDMFSEEKIEEFTEEDYDALHVERMIEGKYKYKVEEFEAPEESYPGGLVPYVFHETPSKKLTMAVFDHGDSCTISLTIKKKKSPVVASYDVIGIRVANSMIYDDTNSFDAKMDGKVTTSYARAVKTELGLADVFKITNGISYASLDTRVRKTNNGVVYGSYQHATKAITLTNASNFTFAGTGYGSVFLWPSSIKGTYDNMSGVYDTLY